MKTAEAGKPLTLTPRMAGSGLLSALMGLRMGSTSTGAVGRVDMNYGLIGRERKHNRRSKAVRYRSGY